MPRQPSVLQTWLIQGAVGALLVAVWLLVRDPTSVVAYPLACASTATVENTSCARWRTLDREYFRINPETRRVVTWEDRPMARAEQLEDCLFEDLENWSCATDSPGVRTGLRDGRAFREIDGIPDPARTYVGSMTWWWMWLEEALLTPADD